MRVVFSNYGQADNNSAGHIFGFARGLAKRGHEVRVALAKLSPEAEFAEVDGFRIASHRALQQRGPGFDGGQVTDVLHVWTTREIMRRFAAEFSRSWNYRALVIHLEDPEEAIFERFTGITVTDAMGRDQEWPEGLIHPLHHRSFLESAQVVTLVHRCLEPLARLDRPLVELPPVLDFHFFSPAPRDEGLRSRLGVSPSSSVIVYNGNDHAASSADTRALYETVQLLIERGRDMTLVRTGHVQSSNYDGLQFRPGPRCIEPGFIERAHLPAVMRLADVVIQPGDADAFNSFRLPAKIPEYLSIGKPLITSGCNIGAELAEHRAAKVLPVMSSRAMADAVEELLDHPEMAAALGARGREFAMNRFNGDTIIPALEDCYQKCLAGN